MGCDRSQNVMAGSLSATSHFHRLFYWIPDLFGRVCTHIRIRKLVNVAPPVAFASRSGFPVILKAFMAKHPSEFYSGRFPLSRLDVLAGSWLGGLKSRFQNLVCGELMSRDLLP